MTNSVDTVQTKIDLREALIEKLERKMVACDQQVSVLEAAKQRYAEDIVRKQGGAGRPPEACRDAGLERGPGS